MAYQTTKQTKEQTKEQSPAMKLAQGWINAWINMDIAWLEKHLADNFIHTSPYGRLEGKTHYLKTVIPLARKSVNELIIIDVTGNENKAVIWFENHTPAGAIPSCDWLETQGEKILSIQSFYDASKVSQVLSEDEQKSLAT